MAVLSDNRLVIDKFQLGIAQSPHVGFGCMRNLDISTFPGVAKLNFRLAKQSSTVVTNPPLWQVRNPINPAEIWALDNAGVVYKSANSGSTWAVVGGNTLAGGNNGQGLRIWKNYLFVARTTSIDVYGPLTIPIGWTNSWVVVDSDDIWHPMIVSKNDNKLYGGAGRFIFSVDENTATTFDPGNAATYTFTQEALDLPPNYRIKCLSEQGNNLMAGTWMGTAITDFKVATIFPWDRSSPSFGQPIELEENGVNAMICVKNMLYVIGGIAGRVFACNGYQAAEIAQIPEYVIQIDGGGYLLPLPGAIMHHKGKVYFGVGGSFNQDGGGVWSLDIRNSKNILNYENLLSTGSIKNSSGLIVGSLLSLTREVYSVGWQDYPNSGIDLIDVFNRVSTSYGGKIESPVYVVGTNLIKRQFRTCEILIAEAMTTGQGVMLEFRTDLSAGWTAIGTFDFATIGAVLSHNADVDIPETELIQIRASLNVGVANNKSVELKSVTLF